MPPKTAAADKSNLVVLARFERGGDWKPCYSPVNEELERARHKGEEPKALTLEEQDALCYEYIKKHRAAGQGADYSTVDQTTGKEIA